MRILHISPNFPFPPNDGGRIVIYNTYKHLKDSGYSIDFICINKTDVNEKDVRAFDPLNEPEVYIDKAIPSAARIIRNLILGKPVFIYKFFSKEFLRRIIKKIESGKYDLLHFEGLHAFPYALEIRRRFDIKSVVRFHNIESQIIYRYFTATGNPVLKLFFYFEYLKIRALERKCYNGLRNVIFITEEDMQNACREGIKELNPLVLNAGVDLKYFSGLDEENPADLLYLGSMDWKPNEDAVIWFIKNVFTNLLRTYPDLKFYIVGKNPSEKMKSFASENITVTGTVDDVRPYIKKAGISVIPLKVGGGMRIKILELMACGKAIVTSTIGAEGICYTNGSDIIIADEAEEMIKEISALIADPAKRQETGRKARQKAAEVYSWQSVTANYINYINKGLKQ